ncbi:uncharacterized protein LOC111886280 [Lactuca sativa]|uniref:uncharacterized protein LOC111886280 n=1 Tax=Lactuca sativa TaxID=4236 RepID=UPI000CD849BC|nr:uncharacterized protein LOC111886280 [Lactuca sativa]
MPLNTLRSEIRAKGREIYHPETKCPNIAFKFVRYSIYGGLTSWDHSQYQKGNKYILVTVDYVSKWAEAQALPTNDAQVVVRFLKKLFSRFGVPKALISDRVTHFTNDQLDKVLQKYGVHHRFSTSYHPQTSGQTEVTNRALNRILSNRKEWSDKLDDALWAF